MGAVYADCFLEHGALVAGLDLGESERSTRLREKYDNQFIFCRADVTSKTSLSNSLLQVETALGSPDVLINNAGIDSPPDAPAEEVGYFEDYPEESWDRVMTVNLKGVFLACQVYGKSMAARNSGSIVNVASIYGLVSPDQSIYQYRRDKGEVFFKPVAYSASKSGILNLTKYLATYWARDGVRVNTLTIAGVYNNQDDDFLDAYNKRIPIGRMANETDYNGALLFLASESSAYMTGSNLVIDGGWTAI